MVVTFVPNSDVRAVKLIIDGVILCLMLGIVCWVSACGGDGATEPLPPPPNRAPTAIGTIPAQTVLAGETVTIDIRSYFTDPDGDPVTYSATTSSAGIASPTIVGSSLTIAGVTPGSATVTVTARDPGGLAATQSLVVSVERPNRQPTAVGTIPALSVQSGQTARVALSGYFADPDGDTLTYTPSTSNPGIASPTVSDSTLTIAGVAQGTATVTVEARDPAGLSAQQSFAVTVERPNQAPVPVDSIAAQVLDIGDTVTVNASLYFRDPDGDALTYTAVSSAVTVASAEASGSTLTIAGVTAGTATVTVQARDPGGFLAEQGIQVTVVNPDRAALVALYHATDGPNWKRSDNWLTDAPLENWYGVTMDSGARVQSLGLVENNLAGSIPSDLGNLSNLRYLGLSGNRLTGSIPRALGRLTSLTSLTLAKNQLTGPIPSDLGNLTKLTRLWIGDFNHSGTYNQLTGVIPLELGNLSYLTELLLGGNQLTGAIPKELGNLASLEHLRLSNNDLTGSIPEELGNLSSLTYLGLGNNDLTGSIPKELGNLNSLTTLPLGSNQLTGAIPEELGNLSSLEFLGLGNNDLAGVIPSEFGNLTSLHSLYVNDNELSGPLPISLVALQSVAVFHYQNTDLCVPANDSLRTWLNRISYHRGTGVDCIVLRGFRDDFSTTASLANWSLRLASAAIADGVLHLAQDSVGHCASAFRDHNTSDWDVKELRMRASNLESLGLVMLRFSIDSTTTFNALFGNASGSFRSDNFYFRRGNVVARRGYFSEIDVAPGEFMDISIGVDQGVITVHVGNQLIFRTGEFGSPRIVQYGMGVCSTNDDDRRRSGLFDWYEANSSRNIGAGMSIERFDEVRELHEEQDVELGRVYNYLDSPLTLRLPPLSGHPDATRYRHLNRPNRHQLRANRALRRHHPPLPRLGH